MPSKISLLPVEPGSGHESRCPVRDVLDCIGDRWSLLTLLTLADGTLAGADIDMLSCVRFVHERLGQPLDEALRMASVYPAEAIGAKTKGSLASGQDADFLILSAELDLQSTWIGGACAYEAEHDRRKASA